jgi:hypothetical protein
VFQLKPEGRNAGVCLAAIGLVVGQLSPNTSMLNAALFAIAENAKLKYGEIHNFKFDNGVTLQ